MLTELSIGPTFSDLKFDNASLDSVFKRLRTFRLRLHHQGDTRPFLALLDRQSLLQLDISIAGEIEVPWTEEIALFKSLELFKICKYSPFSEAEKLDYDTWQATRLPIKHLFVFQPEHSLEKEEDEIKPSLTPSADQEPSQSTPSTFSSDMEALAKFSISSCSIATLFEIPISTQPIHLHPFPSSLVSSDPLISEVELWIRKLRYTSNNLEGLAAMFLDWTEKINEEDDDALLRTPEAHLSLLAHPLFMPTLAEVMRKNATNPNLWAIVTPLFWHLFQGVGTLTNPSKSYSQPTDTWSTRNGQDIRSSQGDSSGAHYHGHRHSMTVHPNEVDIAELALEEGCNNAYSPPWMTPSHSSPHDSAPYHARRLDVEIRRTALLQLIFEHLAPIIETGIDAFGFSEEEIVSDEFLSPTFASISIPAHVELKPGKSNLLRHTCPRDVEKPLQRQKRGNADLLRFIALLTNFPSLDVYPSRLCLSQSDKICSFVMRPWHRGFRSLHEFSSNFLETIFVGFSQSSNNQAFCKRLHHVGLAKRLEEMMELWVKEIDDADLKHSDSAPSFHAYIALFAQTTPSITMDLLLNHTTLFIRMLNLLPRDSVAEWTSPVWSHLMSHSSLTCFDYPSSPTIYCQALIKNVLLSARIHEGGIGNYLGVYLGSFCEHCRHLFVEGLGDAMPYPSRDVETGLDLMSMRCNNFADFAISVYAWFLEPASRVEGWLSQLQDKFKAARFFERRAIPLRTNMMDFFNDLSNLTILDAETALDACEPWGDTPDVASRSAWDGISMASQSPALISNFYSRIVQLILSLNFKVGHPQYALCTFYHISFFKGDELTAELEATMMKVVRDEKGGRRIMKSLYLPYRLLDSISSTHPIPATQEEIHAYHIQNSNPPLSFFSQEEDALSLITEVLLALFATDYWKDFAFILGRLLAILSSHRNALREKLQQSKHLPYLLGNAMTSGITLGEQAALLVTTFEIFGSFSHQWLRNNLSTPLWKAMDEVLTIIPALTDSGQPWWHAVEIFLIGSLFRRSMPLVLGVHSDTLFDFQQSDTSHEDESRLEIDVKTLHIENNASSPKKSFLLTQKQIDTATMLIDTAFQFTLPQDITTREAAFEAIYDALYVPDDSIQGSQYATSPLHTELSRTISKLTIQRIKERYEDRLKSAGEMVHFGFSSQAERTYNLYKLLIAREK